MKKVQTVVVLLVVYAVPSGMVDSVLADDSWMMRLTAPIRTWDEAIPLGNGLTGGLLWGEGNQVRISLDRGDLWDLRVPTAYQEDKWNYETLKALARQGKAGKLNQRFDTPYSGCPYPTKLPGARLVITLAPSAQVKSFELDMHKALGWAELNDSRIECFFSETQPMALVKIPGPTPQLDLIANTAVKKLGYEPAAVVRDEHSIHVLQHAALGFDYIVLVQWKATPDGTLVAIALTTNRAARDPLRLARERVTRALNQGWTALWESHVRWWDKFWTASAVTVPDPAIERHYNLVQYFYGAASRRTAPPIPLQGVWTADSGSLPPWKGDYHNDLNTQLTYWAYLASGHFDQGLSFLDFLWSLKPVHERFAKSFYNTTGLVIPGVMALDGKPMGGWAQYSFSPTNGGWVALAFYTHWRYTMDSEFLKTRAFPYCLAAAEGLRGLLTPDEHGKLKLPLSSSPEIHNNSQQAWLTPNSNYDLAIMRTLFAAVSQMADRLGDRQQAARWRRVLDQMDDLATEPDTNRLRVAPDESLLQSHRHLSHLMSIHPLGILNVEGSAHDRDVIAASLDQLRQLGTRAWTGYSFSWAAAMEARAGRSEDALDFLQKYVHAFILRNGFHVNGDQTRSGLSGFTYRPFTLEGNFAAAQAVHEMLLQSWPVDLLDHATPIIRIFPAVPWRWHAASFERLRAEGGYMVSARRENNATTWLRIEATRDGVLYLRDNFGGRTPQFDRKDVRTQKDDFVVRLHAGEAVEARLRKPAALPPAPKNVTKPFRMPGPIRRNALPLRIGADSHGQSRFVGDIARASVFGRPLSTDEIRQLAGARDYRAEQIRSCVVTWDFRHRQGSGFVSDGAVRE